jgi:hypothetical protein
MAVKSNLNPTQGLFILGSMLFTGSTFAAIVTAFGDFVHYMNRDITTWIYASEGFIAFSMAMSYIMQLCGTRFLV